MKSYYEIMGFNLAEESKKIDEVKNLPIIELYTGQIFDNMQIASEFYNVPMRTIFYHCKPLRARDRRGLDEHFHKLGLPLIFDYLRDPTTEEYAFLEFYNYAHRKEYEDYRNRYNRKVKLLNTGEVFKNVEDARHYYDFPYDSIKGIINVCLGKRASYPTKVDNPGHWVFID